MLPNSTTDQRPPYADAGLSSLELKAVKWLDGFYQLEHLLAARKWAIRLAGSASPELKFAALVHDAERFFPGGPSSTPSDGFDNPDYLFVHSMRSADIVDQWLKSQEPTGGEHFARRVRALILRHEIGGNQEEDILQAADSLSFLETFDWLAVEWVHKGIFTFDEARAKLDWMVARIRISGAVTAILPFYARATNRLKSAKDPDINLKECREFASSAARLIGSLNAERTVASTAQRLPR